MNTSMTINATAPWLLALYAVVAEEQGAEVSALQGTVQNDIVKEYLLRGTYVCPPEPSLRLITDVAAWTADAMPRWNPMNVRSDHLQEAGAVPEQELAYALATAIPMRLRRPSRCSTTCAARPRPRASPRWWGASRPS